MGRDAEERALDGVLLSHAHADHAQYIHFLRADIPIYCSKETKIILQAVEETGSNPLADLVTSCEAFTFYTNKNGSLSRVDRRKKNYVRDRLYKIIEPGKRFKVGSFEVEMLPVDHSMPGACGFIIYTDAGNLVYTGDIRFHGYREDVSKNFVEKSRKAKPRWLLCEGTRIKKSDADSEEGVKTELVRLIAKAKGLVFVEHPIRDLFRAKSILEASKGNDRAFVVGLKLAYLLREMGKASPVELEDVKILVPRKRWGLLTKADVESAQIEKDYERWERDFIGRDTSISYKELQKNPGRFVVSMSFWEINQLTDIKPKDAVWIKSSCEPFNEEMEIDEKRKRAWLDHFRIKEYSAHASGHASGTEIKRILERVRPEIVYPIHTEKPDEFKRILKGSEIKVVIPEVGRTYSL
jgi:ribonuclease J